MKPRARLQQAATQVEIFNVPVAVASVAALAHTFLDQTIGTGA